MCDENRARSYAEEIAKILDPNSEIFGALIGNCYGI